MIKRFNLRTASLGLILGTGFGDIIPFREKYRISLRDIPAFRKLGELSGHKRDFVIGKYKGGKNVIALSGRIHMYEGNPDMVRLQTEVMCCRKIKKLVIASAVGSLDSHIKVGDIVVVSNLLTLYAPSCLKGGEFVSPSSALDSDLLDKTVSLAKKYYQGGTVHRGTHAMLRGPRFESTLDKHILKDQGAEVVGMSGVPELEIAAKYNVPAVFICFVTNDMVEIHSHEKNLKRAHEKSESLHKLMLELLKNI
jgi:purine-nucleoside phosphorylase